MQVYLDNSATTRPCGEVAALTAEIAGNAWFNPSALYKPALEIQKRIDRARQGIGRGAGQGSFSGGS